MILDSDYWLVVKPQVIRSFFENKLKLFQQDPFNPMLNSHALGGKLSRYRSINVTGDWRAIYSTQDGNVIIFG